MTQDYSSLEDSPEIDDGRTPLALAIGLAAALAAGGLWAVLTYVTNMEIGYAAWGVGLLVGYAMCRVTRLRTQQLAYAAAVFAVTGLAAGKAFIFVGSTSRYAEAISSDENVMRRVVAWQLYEDRALDQQTLDEVDRLQAGTDTLSDETWEQMLEQAGTVIAAMTDEERETVANSVAGAIVDELGLIGGIRAQISMFDMLWIVLAVGTAYRMLVPVREPELVPAATQTE